MGRVPASTVFGFLIFLNEDFGSLTSATTPTFCLHDHFPDFCTVKLGEATQLPPTAPPWPPTTTPTHSDLLWACFPNTLEANLLLNNLALDGLIYHLPNLIVHKFLKCPLESVITPPLVLICCSSAFVNSQGHTPCSV